MKEAGSAESLVRNYLVNIKPVCPLDRVQNPQPRQNRTV